MRKILLKTVAVIGVAIAILLVAPSLEAPMLLRWTETGRPIRIWNVTASWYGPGFDGQPTASGQLYDQNAATAAHPWLPLGSVIRVVNPQTGQSQLVRINDRGPYEGDRQLDWQVHLQRRTLDHAQERRDGCSKGRQLLRRAVPRKARFGRNRELCA